MFSPLRIKNLNTHQYTWWTILYWSEGALRYDWNCALEYASKLSTKKNTSLISLVTIDQVYAKENIRQLTFLLESLKDLRAIYEKNNVSLSIIYGDTKQVIKKVCSESNVGAIVISASYVAYFTDIAHHLSQTLNIPVILVDDSSLIPPWVATDHMEYGAYTLRKKYWKQVEMLPFEMPEVYPTNSISVWDDLTKIINASWYKKLISELPMTKTTSLWWEVAAQSRWKDFMENKLPGYSVAKNNPNKDTTSWLSPYLHFWCISPLQIFHEARDIDSDIRGSFFEECFVRRELAINMWYYEKHPDTWECLPNWVIKTLDSDSGRSQTSIIPLDTYTLDNLISARTDDPLWNAAQNELMKTGKIHGYVRMYWWKQFLRWFTDWREWYRLAIYLNDRFATDGCSPNGYTWIAWCFGKHDRPFPPKKTSYGLIRSMTANGMKKKFDTAQYIKTWSDY